MRSSIEKRAIRRIVEGFIALMTLLIVGTMGYRLLEQMSLVDALYMAVITVSTVGFGEVQQLTAIGRLFTIFLIVGGGGIAAYSLSVAAEFVLSGDLRTYLEHRRQQRFMQRLTNHTIVCGYGRMGKHVVDELIAQQLPFAIIEPDPEVVERIVQTGYLVIHGDAANEADLFAAGIERARSLVAVASSDADNVFIVLTARSLRPDIVIVARSNSDGSEEKLRRAGANRVILPYRISGRRMVALLVRPDVADFLDEVMHASQLELLVDQIQLAPDSPLVGQTLGEAHLRSRFGITVLAYRQHDTTINTSPSADTVLRAHAKLIVLGNRYQLQALAALASGAAG